MKKIHIIEVPSELGAGTRGASLGIQAVKVAALNRGSKFFGKHDSTVIETENEMLFTDTDTPNAKYIDGIVRVYDRIAYEVSNCLNTSDDFPLVLAGDHSTAGGTIAGIKKAFPEKRLGVIWIDAHADLHSPHTTPSGNVHGMPVAAALGIDNLEFAVNTISEKEADGWKRLKECGGMVGKFNPQDLVFIAMRDREEPEAGLVSKHGIRNIKVNEFRELGPEKAAEEAMSQLAGCDMVYISFDVDSMDSDEVSEGTGTPVENGLLPKECSDLLASLIVDDRVVCLEMVEVNPCLDERNTMAETAFGIIEEVIREFKAENV